MVWSHGILHSTVRIMDILHRNVAIAVARGGDRRRDAGLCGMRIYRALVLIVFEASGRVDLSRLLLRVFTVGRHLASAIVSPRSAGGVLVALPLIHGGRAGRGQTKKAWQSTRFQDVARNEECGVEEEWRSWVVDAEGWESCREPLSRQADDRRGSWQQQQHRSSTSDTGALSGPSK
jgi:hypothetical protein